MVFCIRFHFQLSIIYHLSVKIKLLFIVILVDHMYIQLIVGDGDLFFIKRVLDALHQGVVYGPVVLVLAVAANGEFQRAFAEFLEPDLFRIILVINHKVCMLDYIGQERLHLFDIRVIWDGDGDRDADLRMGGVVVHLGVRDDRIRDDDVGAVIGADVGVHDVDLLHKAGILGEFDEVARDKGLGEQDHDAAGDIVESILQRQGDCRGSCREERDNARDGDVHRRHGGEQGEGVDQQANASRDKVNQRGINLFAQQRFACEGYQNDRDNDTDHGDDQGASEIGQIIDDALCKAVPHFFDGVHLFSSFFIVVG